MAHSCSHRCRISRSIKAIERESQSENKKQTCPSIERRREGAGSVNEPLIFRRLTLEARGEGVFSEAKVRRAGVWGGG